MPVVFSKPVDSTQGERNKRYINPIIGLDRPSKTQIKKDECVTFKLRSSPTDENSLTYEVMVPFFRNGTPEELLVFLKQVRRVIVGTNTTEGPNKYALIRRVLHGDALTAFDIAATEDNRTETNENFEICCRALIKHVFPRKALVTQKRWMRRFLRKPRDMKTRHFMGRLTEMNEYLKEFPDFEENQKLPIEELMDVAENGIPASWKKIMILQGFDPMESSPTEFVEFCERIEFAEGQTDENKKRRRILVTIRRT